ncbi:hemolysin family protein [Noviherbaspirillum sp. Root189]|uniref:hemolysin family protein n=1 Tax=Noviherbaspirillum sp. Root189 TaxID=1736487 RepID=UPI0019100E34|nr:hemolysin family protein [Noviherbaspirillum sp. Root189]
MDILIILGLIILNGIFAMSELAVVSSKRMRLEKLSENGSRGARAALQLADNPSRFLSTVQVGITLIGIFNGAFGEASLVARLTPQIASVLLLAEYAREIALGIVVVGITFASIVLGELVPKRIAMQYPETVATVIATPMQLLSRIVSPFVKILSVATEAIMRLLGLHKHKEVAMTEEEITGLIKEGTHAGVFEKTEHDIVTRALRLDDQRLGALMTPRTDLEFIDLDDPVEQNLGKIADSPFSRFPVCRGDRSKIIGIVHAGDLFEQAIRGKSISSVDIAHAIKPALYVPESVSGMALLETLKKNRAELAMVVDEYGEIGGMVTLSDVMGALVGDVSVVDDDGHEADAIQREDGSWLVDGGVSLDRFRELLNTDVRFPEEAAGTYHTLAGFVLTQFGHIPHASEHFEWENLRFEVVDMDRQRIDRLLVSHPASGQLQKGAKAD